MFDLSKIFDLSKKFALSDTLLINNCTCLSIHLEFIHCFSLGEDRIVAIGFQGVLKVSKSQNIFFETA